MQSNKVKQLLVERGDVNLQVKTSSEWLLKDKLKTHNTSLNQYTTQAERQVKTSTVQKGQTKREHKVKLVQKTRQSKQKTQVKTST